MSNNREANVDSFLTRWHLIPDGESVVTPSSILVPVRHDDLPAMLKVAHGEEERRGGDGLVEWRGRGARAGA